MIIQNKQKQIGIKYYLHHFHCLVRCNKRQTKLQKQLSSPQKTQITLVCLVNRQ